MEAREACARFLLYGSKQALQEGDALLAQVYALQLQCSVEADIAREPDSRPLYRGVLQEAHKLLHMAAAAPQAHQHR